MSTAHIYFCEQPIESSNTLIICEQQTLKQAGLDKRLGIPSDTYSAMVNRLLKGQGGLQGTYVGTKQYFIHCLPSTSSRHNSPHRCWTIPSILKNIRHSDMCIRIMLAPEAIEAAVLSIARGFPSYSGHSRASSSPNISISIEATRPAEFDTLALYSKLEAVRSAARLVDMPPNKLNVTRFIQEARHVATEHNIPMQVIRGETLLEHHLGGIWAVGKGAAESPALVCLSWNPLNASHRVAWVGKGIVYDSGGLSIKSKTGMPSMKGDMGGAAAVLAAFKAAIQLEVPYAISAVLCLAENAVDRHSTRPDDIITMHSGKNVEINNTDAEGRLVLSDGLSWVASHAAVDTLIDVATLTGAAQIAVGKQLGAIYTNNERLEQLCVESGKAVGEPVYPLPYLPEFHRRELSSPVADMTNSVKDRANAQSSCAAHFIESHLPQPAPPWLHIDIAGPSWGIAKRGTGFGVGLLLAVSQRLARP